MRLESAGSARKPEYEQAINATDEASPRGPFERSLANSSLTDEFMLRRGTFSERTAALCATLGATLTLFIGMPVLAFLLGPAGLALGLGIPVWMLVRYERIFRRARQRIADRRLCFDCGYSLVHAPTTDGGTGTCPECGRPFRLSMYRLGVV